MLDLAFQLRAGPYPGHDLAVGSLQVFRHAIGGGGELTESY